MNVICTKKTAVLDVTGVEEEKRYILPGDKCTIGKEITQALLIEVTYPVSTGTRKAYVRGLENFR